VTSVGSAALQNKSLTGSLTIPSSVTSIGQYAFQSNMLTSVSIPSSVTSIGAYAFNTNSLTSVSIPNSVTTIFGSTFRNNKLTSVSIPSSVRTINANAFQTNKLTSVSIPSSVTSIGNSAFSSNLLTSVSFAGNAPTFGTFVFSSNWGLMQVDVLASATGWGSTWSSVWVNVNGVPGAPTISSFTAGNGEATVVFTAPSTTGGSAITDYVVEYKATSDSSWTTLSHDVSASTLSYTITGLTNGTSYDVRVSAVNSYVGQGAASSIASATLATTLGAPTVDSVVAGDSQVTINFTAPASEGGSAITGYKVTATNLSRPLTAQLTSTGTSSPLVVSGLTNGDQYSFTVTVSNAGGDQATSAVSKIATPASLGTMAVTSLPNGLQATWQALNSGLADHYIVQSVSGDGTTCSVVGTSCVVSELENGVNQVLQISAFDANGVLIFQSIFQAASPKDVPDAPVQVSAIPRDASAVVSWGAPDDQGSAIGYYTVTDNEGHQCETSLLSCTVEGLTPGRAYRFEVRATNGVGTSEPSDNGVWVRASLTPGAPTGVSVDPDDQSLTVSWTAADTFGVSSIAYYTVTDSQGHSCVGSVRTLSCTLLNVVNNVPVVITVTATNVDGLTSAPSSEVTSASGTVPSAPVNLQAVSGRGSTTLTWSAPAFDGGSPVSSYVVTQSDGATCAVDAPQTTCTISNLVGGVAHTFTVVAVNSFGSSMASNEVSSTAYDVPSRPTNVKATLESNGSITVRWTSPAANGSPITRFVVTSNHDDVCSVSGSQSACNFTGLVQGVGYSFTVVAQNIAGESLSSVASATVVDANVPAAPGRVLADRGDGAVLVSWSVPAANGSSILSYVVDASTGQRCETDQTSCLLGGLTNGVPVTFTVTAVNGVGAGAPSDRTAAVTPAGAPSIPANFGWQAALDGSATLSWNESVSNGSPVTGYVVVDPQGRTVCNVTTTSCTVSGLIYGKTYSFRVLSESLAGNSDKSDSIMVSVITYPGAPTQVRTVAGNGSVTVKFAAPLYDGGSPIKSYRVVIDSADCQTVTATSCSFTGLPNGVPVRIHVFAVNDAGLSTPAETTATPIAAPMAPTSVNAVAGNGSAVVSWEPAFDNGSPVTSYLVTSSGGKTCTTKAATSCTVSGLVNGRTYNFTVKATNAVGVSAPSTVVASATPAAAPSVPRNFEAQAGDRSVTFTWVQPARNGGSPIGLYKVSGENTGTGEDTESCTTSEVSCTVDGLTNGQSYKFKVVAYNAMGSSNPSAAVTVVPMTVATAPEITSVVPVSGGLNVTFASPVDNGGSPVTRYQVSINGGDTWKTASVSSVNATSFKITGLVGGTRYAVAIRAYNEVGVSPASATVSATYIATPGAPKIVSAVVSGTTVKVRYSAPTVTGGEAPSMYQYSLDGGLTWHVRPIGTPTEFMLTNLPKSSTLSFRMRAVNSRGYGIPSGLLTLRVK